MRQSLKTQIEQAKAGRIKLVVQEMIVPPLLEDLADRAADVLGKTTLVDADSKAEINEALDSLVIAYAEELISQLKTGIANLKSS